MHSPYENLFYFQKKWENKNTFKIEAFSKTHNIYLYIYIFINFFIFMKNNYLIIYIYIF